MVEADSHLKLLPTSILDVYINPQVGTNSVLERGVPIWEFLSLPAHFHMGTPRIKMGTVVLAGHGSRTRRHCITKIFGRQNGDGHIPIWK
jgi:hypothetical protein